MMFKHEPLDYEHEHVYDITNDEGRTYVIGEKEYPSITTILKSRDPNKQKKLDEWRERIGVEEAEYQTRQSAEYGNQIHAMCEAYLKNEEVPKTTNPLIQNMFGRMKKTLDQIEIVHALEMPLWSDKLKVAGRVDCVATYKGELMIIDFKNSVRKKRSNWIHDYYYQATFYSLALQEMFEMEAKRFMILIACHDGNIQEFVKPRKSYIMPLVNHIKKVNNNE